MPPEAFNVVLLPGQIKPGVAVAEILGNGNTEIVTKVSAEHPPLETVTE